MTRWVRRMVGAVLVSLVMVAGHACQETVMEDETVYCDAGQWLNEAGDGCEPIPEGRW